MSTDSSQQSYDLTFSPPKSASRSYAAATSDAEEDRALIASIALPGQRMGEDREHLAREQVAAERVGDRDGAETAAAHLEVLDEEQARDQRSDPRLPSRAEIDAIYERGDREGWTEESARAVEYLDLRRDIADEREVAEKGGDEAKVAYLDRQREQVDRNHSHWISDPELAGPEPERDDVERER